MPDDDLPTADLVDAAFETVFENTKAAGRSAGPPRRKPWTSRMYGAPRRFDLPLLLAVTTAYAVLLTALRLIFRNEAFIPSLFVFGLVSSAGVCQAILFGGKRPPLASIVGGMAFMVVVWVIMIIQDDIPLLRMRDFIELAKDAMDSPGSALSVMAALGVVVVVGLNYFIFFAVDRPRTAVLMVFAGYAAVLLALAVMLFWPMYAGAVVLAAFTITFGGVLGGYLAGGLAASLFLLADVVRSLFGSDPSDTEAPDEPA